MREIVFDTETTGLSPAGGDRMVGIGCIEMIGRVETGRHYHCYFNPDRAMPREAEAALAHRDTVSREHPGSPAEVPERLNVVDGARKLPSASTCGALSTFHRATALVHSPGISASAMIRARASSPRLVSWVAVAVMPCGHSRARVCIIA